MGRREAIERVLYIGSEAMQKGGHSWKVLMSGMAWHNLVDRQKGMTWGGLRFGSGQKDVQPDVRNTWGTRERRSEIQESKR